jgi:hypothetical protein
LFVANSMPILLKHLMRKFLKLYQVVTRETWFQLYLPPLGPEEWHQWQKDNVLPKQVPVTNYEVNSPTLTK